MKIAKTLKKSALKQTWRHIHRKDQVNQTIQAIHGLCKPFRNFHSSSVLLCLCGQEESYSRRRPQAPLAELPPPSASQPAPPLNESVLFGRGRDQPVGVRTREPGSLPWAGLDRLVPPVPWSGWVKDRPPCLLLQRAPLCHAAWNPAGADLLRERSSARRGCVNSTELAAYWTWSDSRPCWRAAVPAACTAGGLCVFDTSVCLYMPVFADLWLLGRNEKQEKGQGKDAAAAVSVGCAAAAWKWTEQNGNGLNRPWLFHSCMNTAFFPTSLTFQVIFRGETGFCFLRK